MKNFSAKIRTYIRETGTQAFDSFIGLRIDHRYTGVVQEHGSILVSAVGAPVETGAPVTLEQFEKWFKKKDSHLRFSRYGSQCAFSTRCFPGRPHR